MEKYLDMNSTQGGIGFLINFLVISVIAFALCAGTYQGLLFNHHYFCLSIFGCILIVLFASCALLAQTIRRLNAMQWKGMYSILIFIPVATVSFACLAYSFGERNVFPQGITLVVLGVMSALILLPLVLVPNKN